MEHKPSELEMKYLKHLQCTFSNRVVFNIARNEFWVSCLSVNILKKNYSAQKFNSGPKHKDQQKAQV